MGELHGAFHSAIGASLKTELVRRIVENHGHKVTDDELSSLVEALSSGADSVEIPSEFADQTICIPVTQDDVDRAYIGHEESIDDTVGPGLLRVIEEVVPSIQRSLYVEFPKELEELRVTERAFEQRLYSRWREGIDRLVLLIEIATQAGGMNLAELRSDSDSDSPSPDPSLVEVLVALHCRACRMAREIV
ncbi:hypothetical protein Pan216_05160 [Planctomycetes bacterium Pan216]|uniref:Uncharacterized protein n=1 Tax=Kolteria novifilia TaxID=2527975 RepID=A0A518AY99_9BACT|nr:hypothetical protein Pan216_05160 [Planctomycetes bacterium Pan216]